jgi:phosphotransferase family enzyme
MTRMWHPEPGWQPLTSGTGTSTVGVWLAGDRVVKRLGAPLPGDPAELSDPRHVAWWRRPADVAVSGLVDATPGLRSPVAIAVEEDDDGVTVWLPQVPERPPSGLFVARSLAVFAGVDVPDRPWLARHQLRDRLRMVERRGGWPTLARTTVADVADHLWRRREAHLEALDALPQVLQHGDPTPANFHAHDEAGVIALDWATLGTGPVGADLGYWSLSAREEFEPLADAFVAGLPDGLATPEQVLLGARVTAVFTALSRAEWALARAAAGPGALVGKFKHPSVAPYLRSLQRQFPQIEALL